MILFINNKKFIKDYEYLPQVDQYSQNLEYLTTTEGSKWVFNCPLPQNASIKEVIILNSTVEFFKSYLYKNQCLIN